MKNVRIVGLIIVFVFIAFMPLKAEESNGAKMTFVAPAESVAEFIRPLFPYRIDFGQNFSGSFWIQSVRNLRIENGRIFFSTHIRGKDIEYATTVKKQKLTVVLGNVNLQNSWNASLRYDQMKKKLYIKPHIEAPVNQKDLSQGDTVVNALLTALSDVEYPIALNNLKPITAGFDNKVLTIETAIHDVYTDKNKLIIEVIPKANLSK
jgi:hypothetical protein